MAREDLQFELLKTELELTQGQMDKYDHMSTSTKTWAVTLWAASVGWAFQQERSDILFLGAIIAAIFWFFDALNKTFRQDYRKRRNEVAEALATLFKTGSLSANVVSPQLPQHHWTATLRHLFALHLALPYILLIAISLLLRNRI